MAYRDPLEAVTAQRATLEAELARVEASLAASELLTIERDRLRAELSRTEVQVEARRRRHLATIARVARVEVATPCDAHWGEMIGDARKRRCDSCGLDVYDLSAHSLEEVDGLLAARGESPCVRFYRRTDGTILTSDCGEPGPSPVDWGRTGLQVGAFGGVALVAAGAAVVALAPQMGRSFETQTRADAQEVRSAVLLYVGQEAGASCPTMDELEEAGVLDRGRRTEDGWGEDFAVSCAGDDVVVVSSGPDRTFGTEDDIL